jgi:DNA-binding transcriptional LysR family regulator
VELDLGQVRAFVAVVDEGHFGRAAVALSISQQALSKRIARLEAELGVRLLTRGTGGIARGAGGIALTEAGQRFLDPARRVLAAGELATAAARQDERPLRLDVWGHLFLPMRTVRQALKLIPGLPAETGQARDLPAAVSALLRNEIDAGFGRISPEHLAGGELAHRLVRLEPVDAVLGAGHELAGRDTLRPADLGDGTLVFPAAGERLDFLTRFADFFGIASRSYGPNLGLRHLLDRVRADPRAFTLLPADVAAATAGVRVIPLADPVPLYAWSLVWPRDEHHPRLPALLDAFGEAGRESRWLEFHPAQDWLPGSDLADVTTAR